MPHIYLDNSSINQLAKVELAAITKLHDGSRVYISEYSALECGATPDPMKRYNPASVLSKI
jgi:hypothetical protein